MTDYALPVPYSILPGPELRRLALERQELESNFDQQSWTEKANRRARLGEINRRLTADASGRAQVEREAQQRRPARVRDSSCECGGGECCRGGGRLRNAAPLTTRITNLEAAEKRQANEVSAFKQQVRAAGFPVEAEPEQPEYLEPVRYWTR
jgi:hypothetical protein